MRAVDYVDAFKLTREDVNKVLKNFPDHEAYLKKVAVQRLERGHRNMERKYGTKVASSTTNLFGLNLLSAMRGGGGGGGGGGSGGGGGAGVGTGSAGSDRPSSALGEIVEEGGTPPDSPISAFGASVGSMAGSETTMGRSHTAEDVKALGEAIRVMQRRASDGGGVGPLWDRSTRSMVTVIDGGGAAGGSRSYAPSPTFSASPVGAPGGLPPLGSLLNRGSNYSLNDMTGGSAPREYEKNHQDEQAILDFVQRTGMVPDRGGGGPGGVGGDDPALAEAVSTYLRLRGGASNASMVLGGARLRAVEHPGTAILPKPPSHEAPSDHDVVDFVNKMVALASADLSGINKRDWRTAMRALAHVQVNLTNACPM